MPLVARMPPSLEPRKGPPSTVGSLVNNLDLTATVARPGERLPVHGAGRLPHARRPLAGAPAARAQARLGQGPRAALPDRPEPHLRRASRARPAQLLRRRAHEALRLHRAQPRQPRDGRVRPARVRDVRLKEGPLRAASSIAVDPAVSTPSAKQAQLAALLGKLRTCSGSRPATERGPALLRRADERDREARQPHVEVGAAALSGVHRHDCPAGASRSRSRSASCTRARAAGPASSATTAPSTRDAGSADSRSRSDPTRRSR